jgi:PAS domain S-box-containing protein
MDRTRAEQSLAIALDAADMASWDMSLDGADPGRPRRQVSIFGHGAPAALQRLTEVLERFAPEDREAVKAAFDSAIVTGRVEFEKPVKRADDGALRWVHVKGRTFHREDGRPERIAGVVTDVTERRLIDEQLRQSQKMEAIGLLTGGIAHDFNNLLMIIGGSLEAVARRVKLEGRVQELLDAARLGVARGAKLNGQLLAFARRQDMREEVVCINDLLPNFAALVDRTVGETVEVRVRQAAALWSCRTDPRPLETAILNLAINARDAMVAGGSLVLSTANVTVTAGAAERWEAAAGDYVVVSVADSGCGMDASLVARVFEPFFTTKGVGKGGGLGLSQVYGFATQSGGFVSIDSEVGRGTTVSIHLPRVREACVARPAEVSAPALKPAQGVVLLVEDDADVRVAARAMLEDLGYTVREAASGHEAMAALGLDGTADLVFSDVIMSSGMNGIELAQAIRRDYSDIPVFLTSGYTAQLLPHMPPGEAFPLLRKPYTLNDLADFLGRGLEAAHRPARSVSH